MDLALNNLQRLICHKTQQTKPNQKYYWLFFRTSDNKSPCPNFIIIIINNIIIQYIYIYIYLKRFWIRGPIRWYSLKNFDQ